MAPAHEGRTEFAFIPRGSGVLLVPAPELAELSGIAKGAKATSYRDREDQVDVARRYVGADRMT